MRKKPTRTQKTINNINRYIKNVARVFGVNSKEYQQITQQLHNKGLSLSDSNGVIRIENTKANRRKHQTIRAIANRRKPIQILKRPYEKRRKEFAKVNVVIQRGEQAKNFYRWYAELRKDFADLVEEVYTLAEVCDKDGIEVDMKQAFKDSVYRSDKWNEFYDKSGQTIEPSKTALQEWLSNVDDSDVDESTGENYNFDNEYFDGMYGGFEYD